MCGKRMILWSRGGPCSWHGTLLWSAPVVVQCGYVDPNYPRVREHTALPSIVTAEAALLRRVRPLKVTYGLGIDEHDTEGRLICAEYPTHYGATGGHATKVTVPALALSIIRRIDCMLRASRVWCWRLIMLMQPCHVQIQRVTETYWPGAVVTVYVPNAGQGLKRIDYRLESWCVHALARSCV